jgi:hypothetical protein
MTATNSTKAAKDGNATLFNLTTAAESVSGNTATGVYVKEPVNETIVIPAQDGTDGTGITPPSGAVGIRGWLSGLFNNSTNSSRETGGNLASILTAVQSAIPAGTAVIGSLLNIGGTISLPTGASQDGTDGTGIPTPTGGVGIRGWLSGCYSKLIGLTNGQASTTAGQSGPLIQGAVTTAAPSYSTAQTSPLSLDTSGNLRVNSAADALSYAQGSTTSGQTGYLIQGAVQNTLVGYTTTQTSPLSMNLLGGVRIGRTVTFAQFNPAVTNSAYTTLFCVGGLQTVSAGSQPSKIVSAALNLRSVQTVPSFRLYFFSANPTSSTFTDHTAAALNTADMNRLIGSIQFANSSNDSSLGTQTLYVQNNVQLECYQSTFYFAMVNVGAYTPGGTTDIGAITLMIEH